jgi:hypothetical protein
MRQIEKMIAISEQVLNASGTTMLEALMPNCLAQSSFGEVDMATLSARLVGEGWLAPLAQALVSAWTSAIATLENEPVAVPANATMKQVSLALREHVERNAPRLFAQAMQRELAGQTLVTALRKLIGKTTSAESLHLLFQVQCDQIRKYCEQLGNAG